VTSTRDRVKAARSLPDKLRELCRGQTVRSIETQASSVTAGSLSSIGEVIVNFENGSWLKIIPTNEEGLALYAGKIVEEDLTP
jgi:hypothetical protein